MTFSSIFNVSAAHNDITPTKKPNLINCEGCGQAIKKVGGRKCFCGPCGWTNYLWLKKRHNIKYNEQRRLAAVAKKSQLKQISKLI